MSTYVCSERRDSLIPLYLALKGSTLSPSFKHILFPYNNSIGQKFNNIKCGFSLQYYDVQKLWMAGIHVTSENLGSPPNTPL